MTPRILACQTHEWPLMTPGGAAAWLQGCSRLAQAGLPLTRHKLPARFAGLFEAQKTMAVEAARTLKREFVGPPNP